ncbi:MAG: hypothetical protein IPH45_10095 [Bacteroidales bacterium]|nr:hypothetical protein [Bacteroidales bacterium]
MSKKGLPTFIQTYFLRFTFSGTCAGQIFSFTPNFNPTPDSIHWNFGDPLSGMADTSTLHFLLDTFTSAGNSQSLFLSAIPMAAPRRPPAR